MGNDKLYDVPHDLKCHNCVSGVYLPEVVCPSCDISGHITTDSDPVADVPCNAGLCAAAELGAKWMEWWLDQQECECEGGHFCGRDERLNELRIIKRAISEHKKST